MEVRTAKELDSPEFTLIHSAPDDVLYVRPGVLSTKVMCQLGVILQELRCPQHRVERRAADEREAIAG